MLVPLDGGISPGGVAVQERVDRVPGGTLVTRPVVLGGCLHAAWAESGRVFYGANCGRTGDEPTATLPAEGAQETRDGVAFRVNRGLVVLNDLDNGGVWDLNDKPTKIDNWDALVPPTRTDDDTKKKDENLVDEASLDQPPKAEPDTLAVRPGRTSKLHVLDNDTDVAGSVLSIDQTDVTRPTLQGVAATVSGDGQAIDVSVPDKTAGQSFTFSYRVNNGKVKGKGEAKVTVRVVADSVNGPPNLRQGGAKLAEAAYPVIAGKRLSVPVLADWRDPESDILAARAATEGGVVDGQGRITLLAPQKVGKQQIPYTVTDGRGGTTKGTVAAQVIGTTDSKFVAAAHPAGCRARRRRQAAADRAARQRRRRRRPGGAGCRAPAALGGAPGRAARRRHRPVDRAGHRHRQRAGHLRAHLLGADRGRRRARPGTGRPGRPARGRPAGRGARHRDPARPEPGHGRRARQRLLAER